MKLRDAVARRGPLPMPPPELRDLVGGLGPEHFDNPTGRLVYPYLPASAYESVLDFGSGCGRVARQLIQQRPRPERYLGVDLHPGMVAWCQRNLTPRAPAFRFEHHDIYSAGLNPRGGHRTLPLPVSDGEVSLVIALSVFTHCTQDQAEHYLRETARVLRPDGHLNGTWFLFDKTAFPMMQPFQNALYINHVDPSNAVIFDRGWLRETARSAGLAITSAEPPKVRGFQWRIVMQPTVAGCPEVELPADNAPAGTRPPPLMPAHADRLGLD